MIIIFIAFIFFIILTFLVLNSKTTTIDKKVYESISIKEPFTTIFKIITNLASSKFFVLICFILFIVFKNKTFPLIVIILMLSTCFLINFFKHLIKRSRPNICPLVKEDGYSYPSGHTFSALSFYGFLIFLAFESPLIISLKIIIITLLILLILIIGFSRIYLGVHYFTDVTASLFLGLATLLTYLNIINTVLNFKIFEIL